MNSPTENRRFRRLRTDEHGGLRVGDHDICSSSRSRSRGQTGDMVANSREAQEVAAATHNDRSPAALALTSS
jgi:hypothetical protein